MRRLVLSVVVLGLFALPAWAQTRSMISILQASARGIGVYPVLIDRPLPVIPVPLRSQDDECPDLLPGQCTRAWRQCR